jgi:hypothetical protein
MNRRTTEEVGCVYKDGQSLLEGCDGSVSISERGRLFDTPVLLNSISSKFIVFHSGGISGGINEPALR